MMGRVSNNFLEVLQDIGHIGRKRPRADKEGLFKTSEEISP